MAILEISLDACIFIHWLIGSRDAEYRAIEEIRLLTEQEKISAIKTLEVYKEVIDKFKKEEDLIKIDNSWSKVKQAHTITPNFVVGDSQGIYRKTLFMLNEKWQDLSKKYMIKKTQSIL